jgi:hypothetical protein
MALVLSDSTDVATPPGRGVYGLRLLGLDQASDLLVTTPPGWEDLTVNCLVGDRPATSGFFLDDERAEIALGDNAAVVVTRANAEVVFTLPRPVPDRHIVHPYLALPAAVVNRWQGRETFHGGAVLTDDGAWAICGDKSAGKSSTLGWLAGQGFSIISDDLLVLDGLEAMAGPRCIDLRQKPAEELQLGVPLGVVGSRERWRIHPGEVSPAAPMRGWIYLSWGDSVELVPLPPDQRLIRLFNNEALELGPARATAYLDLAALPAWELRRPPRLDTLHEAGSRLIDLFFAYSSAPTARAAWR